MTELKSKIVFKTTDEKWDKLRIINHKLNPEDMNMNQAINRAIDYYLKNAK